MFIYRAYQFRLYPNRGQEEKLNQNLGSSRFIYNHYLDMRQKVYQETSKTLLLSDMKKGLVTLQKEYPWLKEVDSCLLRTSLDDLDIAYQKFFKEGAGFPKFKKNGKNDSYRTVNNRSAYKGKDYVSVCVEEKIEEVQFSLRNTIGIDLGIKDTICCSDGLKYQMTKKIEGQEKRLKGLQKALSRSEKGSKNRQKLILKIQRIYQKIRNMRKYFIHEITTRIVKENDIITCETLDVKEMIENKEFHLAKYITNASFSEIIRQLKYKCSWKGKKFYQVNQYYPSSQICNHCGERNAEVKNLNIREWECKNCGNQNDRDINASINIEERGILMYFKELYGTN